MDNNTIQQLLTKYWEGETTLSEEKILKNYFAQGSIPQEWEAYQNLFENYQQEAKLTYTPEVKLPTRNTRWYALAASIVIILGGVVLLQPPEKQFVTNPKADLGTFNNPEKAFIETQKALNLVSENLNIGIENAALIKEYNTTTKTIFK